MSALASVILTLGGMIPVGTYLAPMLASVPLIVLMTQLSKPLCFGWYGVVALLAVLLCPDKETAFVFVFLGWYPIVKAGLDRMPRLFRIVCKLLLFNVAVAALYGLLILVFQMEALVQEAKETGFALLFGILALGNVTFLLYDLLLKRLTMVYFLKRKQ